MTTSRLLCLTAAVPSKELLSIVTLSWNGSLLYLVPSVTTAFTMAHLDKANVRQAAGFFFADAALRQPSHSVTASIPRSAFRPQKAP